MPFVSYLRIYGLTGLWAVLILFATIANAGTLHRLQLNDLLDYDKPVHLFLFGMQYFLWLKAYSKSHPLNTRVLLNSGMTVSAFGFLTEVLQLLLTNGRTFDILDWIADTAGCLLVYGICRYRCFSKK